ncbi:bifunctional riboflavin kinase/FAD synthetase [Alicyclobacillus acidocaldarius]|uniref:Riboflavin biosynthesis protein n=1 Tax=Alicyclobacillus acidocaldarius subsp. acidocaldarius (strain ATCC 27009 / DSM 446 / BCRC 14685 / JCM 5260 / KCTC 1825 / NBRC 15652 / NCIMB 11725 / NRRL B-14509 / 104-IA) TaxID=521098 RepID=C8WWJ3_ALIAD|nr:bifunctional riboflavin kinase/FAD synthetase [Alicyclobacillus acidocaldarius]ACV58464.1 riboflavin biosynthesis protein RibF [Alicyclobacillus acidocaldarius subsp. acidocaldarius DSM 446]
MKFIVMEGQAPASTAPQVLAIGKFDGVHLGHRAILNAARGLLTPEEWLAVMSFEPHPTYALTGNPEYARWLTPRRERVRLFTELGVDAFYVARFDRAFQQLEPAAFVDGYLVPLRVRHVVVGPDFRFGRGGQGTVDVLRDLGRERGFDVQVVQPVEEHGHKISSSRIREHLREGRVEAAQALLGRPYVVSGEVVHGDKRGRTIGFPTANLGGIDAYVLPKAGVYAAFVEVEEAHHTCSAHAFGVLNAGYRPTVDGRAFQLEVHLLDFDGDLYGKTLRVSFLRRIRDETKFESLEALKAQIARDCEVARALVGLSSGAQAERPLST